MTKDRGVNPGLVYNGDAIYLYEITKTLADITLSS